MQKSIDQLRDAQVVAINAALDQGRLEEADALDDTLEILNELAIDQFLGRFEAIGHLVNKGAHA